MTDEKRYVEIDMSSVEEISQRICKARYCFNECPVPVKNAFLGCTCRPVKHMKECSRLKEYLKKEKRNNERNGKKTD